MTWHGEPRVAVVAREEVACAAIRCDRASRRPIQQYETRRHCGEGSACVGSRVQAASPPFPASQEARRPIQRRETRRHGGEGAGMPRNSSPGSFSAILSRSSSTASPVSSVARKIKDINLRSNHSAILVEVVGPFGVFRQLTTQQNPARQQITLRQSDYSFRWRRGATVFANRELFFLELSNTYIHTSKGQVYNEYLQRIATREWRRAALQKLQQLVGRRPNILHKILSTTLDPALQRTPTPTVPTVPALPPASV